MNDEQQTEVKPHVSPSRLDGFAMCGERDRRRYIEGEIVPPGVAMLRGSGVHGGVDVNFRQKIDSHVDLPVKDIVDAAIAGLEGKIKTEGCSLTDAERSVGSNKVLGNLKDNVVRLTEFHAKEQAPEYQPKFVEEGVRIELPEATHDLFCYIDLLDDQKRITDFKTTGKRKNQADIDHSVQLTTYASAGQILTGEPVEEVRLDILLDQKKPGRQVLSSTRGPDDFKALTNRTNAVLGAINAGIFPPASPGAWWCSAGWCGFWKTCPYVNAEREAKSAD